MYFLCTYYVLTMYLLQVSMRQFYRQLEGEPAAVTDHGAAYNSLGSPVKGKATPAAV